jgi:hypothetical protein
MLGVTEEQYSHSEEYPIFGTGQGSGNSLPSGALSAAFSLTATKKKRMARNTNLLIAMIL